MTHCIHTEMYLLFGRDRKIAKALYKAQDNALAERRKMADAHAHRLWPKGPKGQGYASKTFWRVLANSRLFHAAFCGSPEKQARIAKWLADDRRRAELGNARREANGDGRREIWPPKPVFCAMFPQPTPTSRQD